MNETENYENINKTLDKELSALDWEKELNSKYSEKLTGIFDHLTSKYSNQKLTYGLNIHTVEKMNKANKLKDKVMSLNFSRLDKLEKARKEYFDTITKKQNSENKEKTKNVKQKRKNEIIHAQISSMFEQLNNIRTASSDSFLALDSLLNSHKNFLIVNKFNEFTKGIPILQLKRENFMEKTKPYMKNKQLNLLQGKMLNRSVEQPEINNSHKIKELLSNIGSKGKKIFSTELSAVSKMEEKLFLPKISNNNIANIEDNEQNSGKHKQNKPSKNQHKFIRLPKLNIREFSVDLIPPKVNLYSDLNIRDILNMAKIKRPPFK